MAEEQIQQPTGQSAEQGVQQAQQLTFIKSADELLEIKEEKEEGKDGNELKKTLGYGIIFILALNFIFDSSLFYVPPYGVSFAGKASLLSWILIALIGIYIAMCYGELISLLSNYLSEANQNTSKKEKAKTKARVLAKITEFVGFDGKNYGPFNEGQTIELPEEIASFLEQRKAIELS